MNHQVYNNFRTIMNIFDTPDDKYDRVLGHISHFAKQNARLT